VKTNGEPESACPQHAVTQQQAQRDERDHIPNIFALLEEIVLCSKDECYDGGCRPEADALP
jgi:hypothetical protein